ncbi:MAG TPA: protease pro-enzyme activation domain-containing protein [Acidobacteriaceae bacterium]|nr:protease pro-enzyme activation domain-containing protein [Acidobacteriaceae bacterium]
MKTLALRLSPAKRLLLSTLLVATTAFTAVAQQPAPRIVREVSSAQRATVPGSATPRAQAQYSTGRLAADSPLQGMSIFFSRTDAQEAALKTLIAAQHNPASSLYHQWLTPDQFAARFGLNDADITKIQGWLEQQGFVVESVSRGKDMIRFSGTAAQAEQAFSTELHTYSIPTARGKESHFAAATAISVPSALSGVVLSVHGLDNFKPHTHLSSRRTQLKPNFTLNSYGSQSVFFDPGDIGTVYDVAQEYNSSYTGAGQTIVIVGQSAVSTSDLQAFWSAANITRDNPTMTLVPGTGNSTIYTGGDEAESDLDIEWAGAIAKGAALNFVYVGSSASASTFDSILYAIDAQLGTIISSSYGDCETDLGSYNFESYLQRADAQGQTVLSASGDSGATDCIANTNLTSTQQKALAVDYPASSPYVTAVGGTQISTANDNYVTPGDGYWSSVSGSSSTVTSQNSTALKYIPEQAWNENSICDQNATTAAQAICGGGGGKSSLFPTPSWQTGVSGIPTDNHRYVPDVALNAAIYYPGYLFCTSDQSFWDTADGQQSSCTQGFLDSSSGIPTSGGGTSFATPIFAGMLALINQQQGYTTGQALINPTLYTLAANSSTYSSAFHDITTGNNACNLSGFCSSSTSSSYAAATGYDLATGLGSVDLFNLAAAWPANTGTGVGLISTTTSISPTTSSPALNANDTFTITVAPTSGGGTPSGSVKITVDTNAAITETLTSNGTYTYTTSFSTTGPHTIAVGYTGDSTYAASSSSITVTVPTASSGSGSFTMSATNISVGQGNSGSSTITITPSGGYTGTVELSVSTDNNDLINDGCVVSANNITVSGTAAVTGTVTIDTNGYNCATSSSARKRGFQKIHAAGLFGSSLPGPYAAISILAGLLLAGFIGRRSSKLRVLAGFILLATMGFAFTGCASNSTSSSYPNVPKGTYTITVSGQDTSSSINNTANFTLTVN